MRREPPVSDPSATTADPLATATAEPDDEPPVMKSKFQGFFGAAHVALYPDGSDVHYATVQKLLERLEDKHHVARDRSGHAHRFAALTDRDTLVGRRLRSMAEKLTGGLLAPLLTHLVRAETLTRQERDQLRALIDELDHKKRTR